MATYARIQSIAPNPSRSLQVIASFFGDFRPSAAQPRVRLVRRACSNRYRPGNWYYGTVVAGKRSVPPHSQGGRGYTEMLARKSPLFGYYQLEVVVDSLVFQRDHFLFGALGVWLALVLVAGTGSVSRAVDYLLLALFFTLVSAIWVFVNSRRRGMTTLVGFLFAVLTFFFLPAGAVAYLLLRPKKIARRPLPQKEKAVVFPMPVGEAFIPIRTPLGVLLRLITAAMVGVFFVLCLLAVLGRI